MSTILIIVFISNTSTAQSKIKGNRNVTIIETEVNSFNKLVIGDKFKASIIKDSKASVEIETDENLHDVIQFGVADSVLSFETTKRITSYRKMNITIRYNEALHKIHLKDNAELNAVNTIDNEEIYLKIDDNANANINVNNQSFNLINNNSSSLGSKSRLNIDSRIVNLELNESSKTEALISCDTLNVDMYQRADAQIEGDLKFIKANTINSTHFVGKNLTTNACEIISEDSSDFSIEVLEDITIESSGSSEVYLYGNPEITIRKFSDSAKLHKKEK